MKIFILPLMMFSFLAATQTEAQSRRMLESAATSKTPSANIPVCGSGTPLPASTSSKVIAPGVYLNSATELFIYNPDSKRLKLLAPFTLNGASGSPITDIAIAPDGAMYALDFQSVYALDAISGVLQALCNTASIQVGLGFLPDGRMVLASEGVEILDLSSNTLSHRIVSPQLDGDIAFSEDAGALYGLSSGEVMKFDLASGQMTALGNVGLQLVYGLAAKDDRLLAFTDLGEVAEINVGNKSFQVTDKLPHAWWGAAWW